MNVCFDKYYGLSQISSVSIPIQRRPYIVFKQINMAYSCETSFIDPQAIWYNFDITNQSFDCINIHIYRNKYFLAFEFYKK